MSLRRLLDLIGQKKSSMCRVEGIGAALQLRATTLGDFVSARGEPGEEGINMGPDRVAEQGRRP